jgi:hypothetical protein
MQLCLIEENKMWKQIRYYNYEVNEEGQVRSTKTGKLLKPQNSWNGYRRVTLWVGYNRKGFMVHRLVAETFLPNVEKLSEVNHKNFDKTDNSLYNLEWCSKQQNMEHAKQGNVLVSFKGEANVTSKLTEEKVKTIRTISNRKLKDIAEEFGVSVRTILRIRQRESWKHI